MGLLQRIYTIILLPVLSPAVLPVQAEESLPLHQRIDQAIAATHLGNVGNVADDYDFLCRVYLNLAGRNPSVEETRQFVADPEPSKRAATIDTLLRSSEFDNYFTEVLDVMFMERRGSTRVSEDQWKSFLQKAVQEKWSFDRIVQTILSADGQGDLRGAASFLLEREVESNALTRDISRIFLGRDLQCAQCHDHPNIDDYAQSEYYGIFAFVNRSYLFEEEEGDENKTAYVGEKAEGTTQFSSVFAPDDSSETIPQLLRELTLEAEPRFEGEQAYVISPSKTAAGVPKFSRRVQLARLITHPANEHFSKNIANRLWAHMMGRGLVHPVDFRHPDNPPSHPALLEMLADEFVKTDFDFRHLLHEIALSNTYQMSVELPSAEAIVDEEVNRRLADLTAEIPNLKTQVDDQSAGRILERLASRRKKVDTIDQAITETAKQLDSLKQKKTTLTKDHREQEKGLTAKQAQLALVRDAATAAKKVAESFPDDTALTKTHTNYQEKADQLAKDVEVTTAQLDEKTSLIKETANQTETERQKLAKLQAERMGLVDMVAEARGALLEIYSHQRRRATQLVEKKQQLAALTLHSEYARQRQSQTSLSDRCTELAAKVQAAGAERNTWRQAIADLDQRLDVQRDEINRLNQESNSAAQALAKRENVLDELKEAVIAARTAADQLNDSDLNDVVASLENKQISLNEKLKNETQTATEKQQDLTTAELALETLQREQTEIAAKESALVDLEKELEAATEARDRAIADLNAVRQQLHQSWEHRFVVRTMVPLTPAQLSGRTISAFELKPRFQHKAKLEWEKKHQDKKDEEIDESQKRKEIADLVQKRINEVTSTYVSLFAAPGGSPQDIFSATVDQALFYTNDNRVQGWLNDAPGSLLKRLQDIDQDTDLADELYVALFARPATAEERTDVEAYLAERQDDRTAAIKEVAWGLLTSLEFRFIR